MLITCKPQAAFVAFSVKIVNKNISRLVCILNDLFMFT